MAKMGRRPRPALDRFSDKYIPEPNSGCWLWTAGYFQRGYGQFFMGGTSVLAHRASFVLYRGPIPDGLFVCHKCDTPACVNPDHLFLGTPTDNINDMIKKGRAVTHPGETNPQSKLTEEDVRKIRKAQGTLEEIAEQFGVCFQNVSLIKNGKTWGHVT